MLTLGLVLALAASAAAAPTSSSSASSSSSSSAPTDPSFLTADGYTSQKWIDSFNKAKEIVSQMTLHEKLNFTDLPADTKGCAGLTWPIERFNVSSICFADGPTGIYSRYSSQYPTSILTGATWDQELWSYRADIMSKEYQSLGGHVPLSIVAGPLGVNVYGGRNWEGFGADPYLSGVAVRDTVEGFQKNNVHGHVKHFFGNEQEKYRYGIEEGFYGGFIFNQTISANIDAATTRETFTFAFAEGIRAGAGSIMCSYNKVNETLSCENDEVVNKLLKEELNLGGFVVTDWGAAYHTKEAALAGTDFVESTNLYGALLTPFVENGTVSEALLDDKVVRLLTPYFALDQHLLPEPDYARWLVHDSAPDVNRKVAEGGFTLLKNVRSAENPDHGLPLNKPKDLVLVGSAAGPGRWGMFSDLATLAYYSPTTQTPGFVSDGTGSGSSPQTYAIDPYNAITKRVLERKEHTVVDAYLSDNATEGFASVIGYPDVNVTFLDYKCNYASSMVVFVSALAGEGTDRETLSLYNNGDELIDYVASSHNDTIVVITAPGPVDMSKWIDHDNVTAVLFTYFPTTEGGPAVASLLYGDVNPSGKLPFTIAADVGDYDLSAYYNGSAIIDPQTNYTMGDLVDYKHFDAKNITPLYEFGFGLSYTTFSFSDLKISSTKKSNPALVRETNEKFFVNGEETAGLYDYVYTVQATVKNIGSVTGAEVAQMYVSWPDSTPRKMPVRQLRGFDKQNLKAGKSATVSFELRNKDLAYYSTVLGGWTIPSGDFTVSVGSSSRKLPLTGTITF